MVTNKQEKQTYNQEQYIKRLSERREEYQNRLEFVASFVLDTGEENNTPSQGQQSASGETGSAVTDEGLFIGGTGEDTRGILALGKTKMKAPYVFGAAGPNNFDCSGFVTWVYNRCGYEFARGTAASLYAICEPVSNPKLYDLVFFSNTYKPGISHIGIYMGNNEMLHTANVRSGVQISAIEGYWKEKKPEFRSIENKYKGNVSVSTSAPVGSNAVMRMANLEQEKADKVAVDVAAELIGDGPVYPPAGNEGYYESRPYVAPYLPVKFSGKSIKHSATQNRVSFMHSRIAWVRTTKMEKMKPLNKERFIHQSHYDGYEGNLYSPDAKRAFENLLLKTKKPYFEVISGFRFSEPGQLSPHEAGCAIDILVRDYEEVREIADCAWQLGIRSIAVGGDFDANKGFIHLDIAPKGKDFSYEGIPIYGGPGKWEFK